MKKLFITLIALILSSGCGEREPLRICFTGDVMFDRGIRKKVEFVGYDVILEEFRKEFQKADFTVINMESPTTYILNPRDKCYVFRSDPECLLSLKNAGVTHLNLANNHSYDQNTEGFISTVANIEKLGLIPVGVSVMNPVTIQKNNIFVALFAFNWVETDFYSTVETDTIPAIDPPEEVISQIESYSKNHPKHHIIVNLHWGLEHIEFPENEQVEIAHKLIEVGAEAIIGHHPHVIQPHELYKGKHIYYSLGNLIFDQSWVEESGKCVILEFN